MWRKRNRCDAKLGFLLELGLRSHAIENSRPIVLSGCGMKALANRNRIPAIRAEVEAAQ